MSFENIPTELKLIPQWVNYNSKKIPISPHTGRPAQSNNQETWSSFEKAETRAKACGLGVGFVFTQNDPYIFVDFDKVEDHEKALKEIESFNSYTEISPSGNGYHVICTGNDSIIKNNKSTCNKYEVYKTGRYATFTGDVLNGYKTINKSDYFETFYKKYIAKEEKKKNITIPNWIEQKEHEIESSDINDMLNYISPNCDYDTWLKIGMALKSSGISANVFESWSSRSTKYKPGEPEKKYRSFKKNDIKIGTLVYYALENGYTFPEAHIDEVDLSFILEKNKSKNEDEDEEVKLSSIRKIVNKTILKPFVEEFEDVMIPSLPLTLTFGKAITTIGLALSGKTKNNLVLASGVFGADLSRVRIGGDHLGIPPNFYCVNVAESGAGKDVGGIFEKICFKYDWHIPGGSAEGVMDELIEKDAACLSISEMQKFFDKNHWESKINSFLTEVYNKYFFKMAVSKRTKDYKDRKSEYTALSMLGNIQPKIYKKIINEDVLNNGFLGRCLFFVTPEYETAHILPNEAKKNNIESLYDIIEKLQKIEGQFYFNPENIIKNIQEFARTKKPHSSLWKRLFSEQAKKLAFIFSIDTKDYTIKEITDEAVNDAITVVKWIYYQAIDNFNIAIMDKEEKRFNEIKEKIHEYINSDKKGKTGTEIAHRFCYYKKQVAINDIIESLIIEHKIIIETITTAKKPKTIYKTA